MSIFVRKLAIKIVYFEAIFDKFKEKEIDKVNKYYLEENMLKAVENFKRSRYSRNTNIN